MMNAAPQVHPAADATAIKRSSFRRPASLDVIRPFSPGAGLSATEARAFERGELELLITS